MLCDECQEKPATVHLIQVFNGEKQESHLCEECAAQKSGVMLNQGSQFSVPNLLGGMFGSIYNMQGMQSLAKTSKCPNCGMSSQDIRQLGKLGCSECFKLYEQELEASLRRIHGNSQHIGKVPVRGGHKVFMKKQIDELKNQLQEAVRQEEYEKAAQIRDELKELERSLS